MKKKKRMKPLGTRCTKKEFKQKTNNKIAHPYFHQGYTDLSLTIPNLVTRGMVGIELLQSKPVKLKCLVNIIIIVAHLFSTLRKEICDDIHHTMYNVIHL